MPPPKQEQAQVPEQPSLSDLFAALFDTAWKDLSNVNVPVVPIVLTVVAFLAVMRCLAPAKFHFMFYYFSMGVLAPVCAVLEITLVPVLRFLKRRMKEENNDSRPYIKASDVTPPAS